MATITSLLRERVALQINSVDRIFLAGYIPRLQSEGMVVRFLLDRGFVIPSPAALGKVGAAYVRAVERFASKHRIVVVDFRKGESKEEVARRYMREAERVGRFGVVMIGIAQEKISAWRGYRHGGSDAHPHFCYGRMSVFPNHFYFYIRGREWGPAFIETVAYASYGVWVYLNRYEWAKRQATKRGISFEALDNGFRSVEDAVALHTLYYRDIGRFFEYWQAHLPSPLNAADRERGYGYRLSIRQLELSDTRVPDRPTQVREWFELMLKDQLALGRPDNVQLVFARRISRRTPGRFRTRVITRGVEPQIQAHYKHSKAKQYLKQGCALRTETTINDPQDFGVQNPERHQLAGADPHRRRDQRAAAVCPARRLRVRARLDHAPACRVAVDRGRPTSTRPAPRRAHSDGAALPPVLLPPPVRRAGQQEPARAGGRAHPGLQRPPDHLRPAPPAAQSPHPPRTRQPLLPADRPRPEDRRLLHEDLHPHPHPRPLRTRPHPPRREWFASDFATEIRRFST